MFYFDFSVLQGCYTAVINWVMSNLNIVIGVAIGFGAIEIVGIIFAFCLTKSINSAYGK